MIKIIEIRAIEIRPGMRIVRRNITGGQIGTLRVLGIYDGHAIPVDDETAYYVPESADEMVEVAS